MARNLFIAGILILFISSYLLAQQAYIIEPEYSQKFNDSVTVSNSVQTKNYKNRDIAAALTIGVPLITIVSGSYLLKNNHNTLGSVLVAGGIIFGPSAGNMYARNQRSVVKGIRNRLVGLGLLLGGTYFAAIGLNQSQPGAEIIGPMGIIAMIGGSGIILYSSFYDLANSPRNVEKYNARLKRTRVSLSPTYFPVQQGPGVSLNIQF